MTSGWPVACPSGPAAEAGECTAGVRYQIGEQDGFVQCGQVVGVVRGDEITGRTGPLSNGNFTPVESGLCAKIVGSESGDATIEAYRIGNTEYRHGRAQLLDKHKEAFIRIGVLSSLGSYVFVSGTGISIDLCFRTVVINISSSPCLQCHRNQLVGFISHRFERSSNIRVLQHLLECSFKRVGIIG